ncbi:MAG: choice-of-anchor B family protein [Acidobacteriota bacterium]
MTRRGNLQTLDRKLKTFLCSLILFASDVGTATPAGPQASPHPRTFAHEGGVGTPEHDLEPMSRTPCENGVARVFPCGHIDLLAFLPLSHIGGDGRTTANDIWGWTDPETRREFALVGLSDGTAFVEITNPEEPTYLGKLPTHSGSSLWRDIKVYKNHAYIVSEARGHGLQIFALEELLRVNVPPVTFESTIHYTGGGLQTAHNIVINEDSGFAYAVGSNTCAGGLHMIDIRKPRQPAFVGCFAEDGYTHDAQCVVYRGPDSEHAGREVCFNSNEDTLTIVDVTDKGAPRQLSRTTYPGVAFTHQSWTTEDQMYLLLDDEQDEDHFRHNTRTYIWDISDLDRPILLASHTAATPAIDHNLYIHRGFAYQANYRAGLRIYDLRDIALGKIHQVGAFDVYRGSDGAAFNGAWSVYPFFPSRVVVVSGIEQGLFVLEPRLR